MKTRFAITLLLLSTCLLAVHVNADGRRRDNNHHDNDHHDKHGHHYKTPVYHKPVYKPKIEYYCTYFYYDYCPNNWYDTFYAAVTEYNRHSHDVYGCSFGNEYNYGYHSHPSTKGGYICFKYEASCTKFWSWFYQQGSYNSGFAGFNSGAYHYKTVKSYNLPKLTYTY